MSDRKCSKFFVTFAVDLAKSTATVAKNFFEGIIVVFTPEGKKFSVGESGNFLKSFTNCYLLKRVIILFRPKYPLLGGAILVNVGNPFILQYS